MTATIPACPVCQHNFDANFDQTDADGVGIYVCEGSHGGTGPKTYQPAPAPPPQAGVTPTAGGAKTVVLDERVTDDLLDPLRACIAPEDGWTEFGVVEYRLSRQARPVFARHVEERGHHMFGGGKETASGKRVSMALRRLEREGLLVHREDRSTGAAWKHTPQISFWAVAPVEAGAPTLTWTAHCAQLGRSDDWTDEDRADLTSPVQGVN